MRRFSKYWKRKCEQDTQGDSDKVCDASESWDIKDEVELNEELGNTSESDASTMPNQLQSLLQRLGTPQRRWSPSLGASSPSAYEAPVPRKWTLRSSHWWQRGTEIQAWIHCSYIRKRFERGPSRHFLMVGMFLVALDIDFWTMSRSAPQRGDKLICADVFVFIVLHISNLNFLTHLRSSQAKNWDPNGSSKFEIRCIVQ